MAWDEKTVAHQSSLLIRIQPDAADIDSGANSQLLKSA
jgi:hypothetical protein